jgi:outer membrane receptor protein involved in Fe transport
MFMHSRFLCFTALTLFCTPILAAELEEVIVEAQQTSSDVKFESVSQTTLSQEWISDLYVDSFEELSFFVPGLYVQEEGVNSAAYAIRGMTTNNSEATRTPRVSVWLHGMDISRTQGAYTALFDIERVDIYKGPVGSFFARGGQIGGVNIENHFAELDTKGKISGQLGNENEVKITGFYNQQFSDSNAMRLAVYHHQRDGYIETQDGNDLNSVDTQAARLSFVQFIGNTQFDLQINVESDTPSSLAFQSFDYSPSNPYEESNITNADDLYIDRDIADIFAKLTQTFSEEISGEASVMYREVTTNDVFDPDGSELELVKAREAADYSTFETVFKLNYENDRYKSSLGLGYFYEDVAVTFDAHINEQLAIRLPVIQSLPDIAPYVLLFGITTDVFDINGNPNPYTGIDLTSDRYEKQIESVENETLSVFFDNTVFLTDVLSLSFGLRLAQETLYTQITTPPYDANGQPTETAVIGNLFLVPQDATIPTSEAKEDAFGVSGRLSLNFALTDQINMFTTYARGRRPDILNYTEQSVLEHLVDETVDSYEVGMTIAMPETYSQVDMAMYYYDFKHFATSAAGVSALSFLSDDNASATVTGVEIAYTQFFSHDILLFTNLTYNDAVFDESALFSGENRFRYAPLWSGSISLSKDFTLTDAWRSRLTWQESFQSEIYFEDDNNSNFGRNKQGGYGLMNIYLDFIHKDALTLNAFIKNAADKEYIIDAGNFGQLFGLPTFVPGMGRHFGVGVSYAF